MTENRRKSTKLSLIERALQARLLSIALTLASGVLVAKGAEDTGGQG